MAMRFLSLLGSAATVAGLAVGLASSEPASAQGWRDYDRYERPRYDREPDWGYRGRFDRRFDDDEPPRRARRWRDMRDDEGDDDFDRAARPDERNTPRVPPRGRVPDDYDDPDDDDGREARPRAAPRDTDREVAHGQPVMGGGPRPVIAAAAPPRVAFPGGYTPGAIIIDTSHRKLYYVTGPTSAFAYPIGVGREGFSWTGSEKVSRVADWPDWHPPAEMRQRKPELPEKMLGGINNPLGAKAIYLGNTLYRIHGTNDPKSIGKAESSGCFRMLNQHVLHLASLVQVGTPVTVMQALNSRNVVAQSAPRPRPAVRPAVPRWTSRGYDPYDERYER